MDTLPNMKLISFIAIFLFGAGLINAFELKKITILWVGIERKPVQALAPRHRWHSTEDFFFSNCPRISACGRINLFSSIKLHLYLHI